jgi:hypothetical protein
VQHTADVTRVRNILEHATDHPWRIQDVGILALWLDDQRLSRVHVWDPESAVCSAPVHDHPFDFTSTVVVGELVNTRYVEDPGGVEYVRERYVPPDDTVRRADTVRLVGTPETLRAGDRYRQVARELHDSTQVPGTVTMLHFDQWLDDLHELTTCRPPGTPWVSGRARPATHDEVARITGTALSLIDGAQSRR